MANLYYYTFGTKSDTNLSTPLNGDKPYGLSHIEFCTDDTPRPRLSRGNRASAS